MGRNIGKNISKNLSGKYMQKFLDHGKTSAIHVSKTASKIGNRKKKQTQLMNS